MMQVVDFFVVREIIEDPFELIRNGENKYRKILVILLDKMKMSFGLVCRQSHLSLIDILVLNDLYYILL